MGKGDDVIMGAKRYSLDGDAAARDPLFWLGMAIDYVTFGFVDTGRWKKYVRAHGETRTRR